jgi:serine/threonine protein kinase
MADALAHAKALARINHTNVVRVFHLDKTVDPDSGAEVNCVVMELIDGETLSAFLASTRLSLDELRRIGIGLIDGLTEIHAAGLAHSDLHNENVMVTVTSLKILDILYCDSLAILSTVKKNDRLNRDLRSLRLMMQDLISHSELDPAEAGEFNALLKADASLQDIREAFEQTISPAAAVDEERQLEHAYKRFTDGAFVDSAEYAFALADITPPHLTFRLLSRIVSERSYDHKRCFFTRQLWQRLSKEDKQKLATQLANDLDENFPKGKWWPTLQLITYIGKPAWTLLPQVTQLRIEGAVVNDTLAGYHDIYSVSTSKGAMGTYAMSLWEYMSGGMLSKLADNLISLLRQSWYTQNYVGKHFMHILVPIAEKSNKEAQMLDALDVAFSNDARLIKTHLKELPEDWATEIMTRQENRKWPPPTGIDALDDDIPF